MTRSRNAYGRDGEATRSKTCRTLWNTRRDRLSLSPRGTTKVRTALSTVRTTSARPSRNIATWMASTRGGYPEAPGAILGDEPGSPRDGGGRWREAAVEPPGGRGAPDRPCGGRAGSPGRVRARAHPRARGVVDRAGRRRRRRSRRLPRGVRGRLPEARRLRGAGGLAHGRGPRMVPPLSRGG